jgi:hypothetical protein
MGENMKFEMVMEFVDFADVAEAAERVPAEELVPDPDPDPGPPLLQAARSTAAARTRTTAPPLDRRAGSRIVQTACEVGLNARGVPEEVCAPGYIPST